MWGFPGLWSGTRATTGSAEGAQALPTRKLSYIALLWLILADGALGAPFPSSSPAKAALRSGAVFYFSYSRSRNKMRPNGGNARVGEVDTRWTQCSPCSPRPAIQSLSLRDGGPKPELRPPWAGPARCRGCRRPPCRHVRPAGRPGRRRGRPARSAGRSLPARYRCR